MVSLNTKYAYPINKTEYSLYPYTHFFIPLPTFFVGKSPGQSLNCPGYFFEKKVTKKTLRCARSCFFCIWQYYFRRCVFVPRETSRLSLRFARSCGCVLFHVKHFVYRFASLALVFLFHVRFAIFKIYIKRGEILRLIQSCIGICPRALARLNK